MRHLLLLALVLPLASCASTANRGPTPVSIDSVPTGARITYMGAPAGITPCSVLMWPTCSQVLLEFDGYHPQVVEVGASHGVDFGSGLGVVATGSGSGLAAGVTAGVTKNIDPRPCYVEFTPLSEPRPAVWFRPKLPLPPEPEWIREGQVPKPPPPLVATRAAAWTPPRVPEEEQGWIRAGQPVGKR